MSLQTYNLQVLCGNCQSPAMLTLRNLSESMVKQKVKAMEAMLKAKLPKCEGCDKVPAKYNFVIKDQDNKVIPASFFDNETNIDTITT